MLSVHSSRAFIDFTSWLSTLDFRIDLLMLSGASIHCSRGIELNSGYGFLLCTEWSHVENLPYTQRSGRAFKMVKSRWKTEQNGGRILTGFNRMLFATGHSHSLIHEWLASTYPSRGVQFDE